MEHKPTHRLYGPLKFLNYIYKGQPANQPTQAVLPTLHYPVQMYPVIRQPLEISNTINSSE